MTWVFFLAKNLKALDHFKRNIYFIKKQTRHKFQTLNTKNGEEFMEFNNFLALSNIKYQMTILYTPQQNGVVECENCMVKEMA